MKPEEIRDEIAEIVRDETKAKLSELSKKMNSLEKKRNPKLLLFFLIMISISTLYMIFDLINLRNELAKQKKIKIHKIRLEDKSNKRLVEGQCKFPFPVEDAIIDVYDQKEIVETAQVIDIKGDEVKFLIKKLPGKTQGFRFYVFAFGK